MMSFLKAIRTPGQGSCEVCSSKAQLNARICHDCESTLGRRTAELIARARGDQDFAKECFAKMNPLGQRRFSTLLGDPTVSDSWVPSPVQLQAVSRGPGLAKARSAAVAGPGLARAREESLSNEQLGLTAVRS